MTGIQDQGDRAGPPIRPPAWRPPPPRRGSVSPLTLVGVGALAIAALLLAPAVLVQNQWLGIGEDAFRLAALVAGVVGVLALGARLGMRVAAGEAGPRVARLAKCWVRLWWLGLLAALVLAILGYMWLAAEDYGFWVIAWGIAVLALLGVVGSVGIAVGRRIRRHRISDRRG
jgi:hypothetical protein